MTALLYTETFGSGPDMVLVHGWGMHGAVWDGFAQDLAKRFRLTVVDLPGHGRSPLLADGGTLAGWAKAVLAAAPQRAVWLGWSLGGLVAMQAAAMQPERVQRLITLCSNPVFVARQDWPAAMAPELFAGFLAVADREGSPGLARFLILQTRGLERPRSVLKMLQASLLERPTARMDALTAGLDILGKADLRPALTQLNCPAMAVLGARDALVPVAVAADLEGLSPRLRVNVVDGAAHQPFLSHPAATLDAIAAFLSDDAVH